MIKYWLPYEYTIQRREIKLKTIQRDLQNTARSSKKGDGRAEGTFALAINN